MLLETGTGKRTGAVAAALTLESLAVAILILIPLFFAEGIPVIRPWMPIVMPVLRPISEPPQTAATSTDTENLTAPPRPFEYTPAPRTVPTGPVVMSGDSPPSISGAIGTQPAGLEWNAGAFAIADQIAPRAAAAEAEPVKTAVATPQRVGGDVQEAKLIRKVMPVYPELAKRARVSGTVRLVGVIAKDGTIEKLQVVSGNPLLVPGALEAVRQWIYKPTLLNGAPVEVIAPIDVIFSLGR